MSFFMMPWSQKNYLAYARPSCKLIYVGKRKGKKEFSQEEINQLLVFYAARFNCVVRLKGGDPYVFGRGHEELEYAVKRGVHVEVIPGISSALAAPASAGIPLTKRGVNESFWVITGTLSSGEISNDIRLGGAIVGNGYYSDGDKSSEGNNFNFYAGAFTT